MKRSRNLGRALFWAYAVWMIWLLYLQRIPGQGGTLAEHMASKVNLTPFETIGNYFYVLRHWEDPGARRQVFLNLAGNVAMFVPLGFFLPLNDQRFRPFRKLAAGSLLIITQIELTQLLTRLGSLDVDDLILNMAGTVLGWICWKVSEKFRWRRRETSVRI